MNRYAKCVCAVCALLVICASASASVTITLQDGTQPAPGWPVWYGTTDAWLDKSDSDENNGGLASFEIRYDNGVSDTTVMKFDLSGQIPQHQRILSATLNVWYTTAGSMYNNNAMQITPYRINPGKSWYENTGIGLDDEGVNWDYRDQNQTLPWSGPVGGAYNDQTNDGNSSNKIKKTGGDPLDAIEPQNWVPFTVTNSVGYWYGEPGNNNGFVLVATGFQGTGSMIYGVFGARDDTASAYRPKLTITYEGALLPIADADGPYNCPFEGSIELDGSGSEDPDGGDIVSWLWDLDNDGDYDDASGELTNVGYDYLVNTLGLTPGEDNLIGLKVIDDENEAGYNGSTIYIVPEPATLSLLVIGGAGVMLVARRRRAYS